MDTYIYKCPNCDSGLEYDAKTHIFHCDYCRSDFTAEELEENKRKREEILMDSNIKQKDNEFGEHAVLYSCPSCGAEIMTDENTAATFCYYCHNPVVLSGRLSGDLEPSYIIPFKIDREEAEKRFFKWVSTKKFLPKNFVNEKSVGNLCGVYYPYWITDCTVSGMYTATGKNLRVWIAGDLEYTETKIYDIRRAGTINLDNIKNFAMTGKQLKLATAVQPFKDEEIEDFKMSYLSGFMAEKRNLETEDVNDKVKEQVRTYSARIFEDSISGYNMLSDKKISAEIISSKWDYVLLPVWVLTYFSNGKTYYYALNGQTGKAVGELPISKLKISIFAIIVFAAVFLIIYGIGGIIL